jgi:pimeloyl-ACP methyl ester carboxylesterase
LEASTLIVWGTDDVYFPVKWAHWLAEAIPGAKPPVELEGARLFFPEERAEKFNRLLRSHLLAARDCSNAGYVTVGLDLIRDHGEC